MKITVKKRYICPASEVFEMEGNDVLLAGSVLHNGGYAGETTNEEDPEDEALHILGNSILPSGLYFGVGGP